MNATMPPSDAIKPLINICKLYTSGHVLVVGDVILDRFVYGSVDRISPESPVPVLALSREDTMLGGAGNAFANLVGLGVKASILSVVGHDDNGEHIKQLITGLGVDNADIIIDPSRPTSVKTRFLAGHQQLLRSDFEVNKPLAEAISAQLVERFKALLPSVGAVIFSDYGKGIFSPATLKALIDMARAAGVPVIVDPKGKDFSIYRGASAVTPNKKELSDATQGMAVSSDSDIEAAAGKVIKECGIDAVIATRSADGMSVIRADQPALHVESAKDIEVFDVSGAGDTVIATIAATVAAGETLDNAALLANLAGSIAVTKVGTAPIRVSEIITALEDGFGQAASARSRSRQAPLANDQDALDHVKRWKARGLKVGFTNGCFDIIHAGHVTYLNEARNLCDRLIVALNHDASVRILKGPERPVHDQIARATVLGALASVDLVVLFGATEKDGDNTASHLLELLKPDLYFKGGDYAVDDIPETPTVRAYGGDVKVLSNVEGYSTTSAIEKIRDSEAA